MQVKQYLEIHLERGGVAIMVSLDVQGAFDSAWWPAILQRLREAKCPRNLYYLVQDCLKERSIHSCKQLQHEKEHNKGIHTRVILRSNIMEHPI